MLMMKRGKLAGKTLGNLMFHHYSNLRCRSNDVQLSFVAPREYEFSCSNSSAYPFHFPVHVNKRKDHHHFYYSHHHHRDRDEIDAVNAVQKVFEMLNYDAVSVEASPLVNLPGFGKSPMVQARMTATSTRQLRNLLRGFIRIQGSKRGWLLSRQDNMICGRPWVKIPVSDVGRTPALNVRQTYYRQ